MGSKKHIFHWKAFGYCEKCGVGSCKHLQDEMNRKTCPACKKPKKRNPNGREGWWVHGLVNFNSTERRG